MMNVLKKKKRYKMPTYYLERQLNAAVNKTFLDLSQIGNTDLEKPFLEINNFISEINDNLVSNNIQNQIQTIRMTF